MSNKILTVGLIIALALAGGAYFFPKQAQKLGASATDVQNTVYSGLVTLQTFVGGSTAASSVGTTVSTGTCNAGSYAASSTLFAVASPFTATSTATLQVITGTGQATTSTLLVGTSTLSTGVPTTIGGTLVNATISTSTPFWTSGGVLAGSAGYNSPGANTFRTIVVGPSEFVVGEATSTATGVGAAQYTPGVSCTYKIEWRT